MGPGTGLGAAQLFWDTGKAAYTVVPGEGAHATFAPRGWRQQALASWVTTRIGHCEIEEVACGRGLELIYEFLVSDETAAPHLGGKAPALRVRGCCFLRRALSAALLCVSALRSCAAVLCARARARRREDGEAVTAASQSAPLPLNPSPLDSHVTHPAQAPTHQNTDGP